jgi:hypothetical protein
MPLNATDQLHLNAAAGTEIACKLAPTDRSWHQRRVQLIRIAPIVTVLLVSSCSTRESAAPAPEAPTLAVTRKAAKPSDKIARLFPPGVDWSNATPEQISEVVSGAVKSDPDNAVEILTTALDSLEKTGRFPVLSSSEAKQSVDPEPKRTLFDVLFPRKRSAQ